MIFGARYQYHTNTNFLRYRHSLTIDNYYTERNGDVEDNYTVPDWTTNNSISNNVITINNSGADHSLGRILCMPESGTDYYWSILYDSQNKNSITLPKLPEELNAYSVYDIAQSNNIEITQSEITSLSSISNYQNFIERVIKVNEFPYLVADKIETIFNSTSGTRNPSKDLFFK